MLGNAKKQAGEPRSSLEVGWLVGWVALDAV